MVGDWHEPVGADHDGLGEHAVPSAAERRERFPLGRPTVDPSRHEGRRDSVADLPAGHALTERGDYTGTVGKWDIGNGELGVVLPFEHHQVAEVQRHRSDPHGDLTRPWRRLREVVHLQTLRPAEPVDANCFHEALSRSVRIGMRSTLMRGSNQEGKRRRAPCPLIGADGFPINLIPRARQSSVRGRTYAAFPAPSTRFVGRAPW